MQEVNNTPEINPIKKKIILIILYYVIGLIIAGLCTITRNPFTAESTQDALKYWSDITIIPAVCLYGICALAYVAKQGIFDGLTYSIRFVVAKIIPMPKLGENLDSYADYKEHKNSKRKPIPVEGLIAATTFLITAIICYIAYYCV